jgi:hypothetical protein
MVGFPGFSSSWGIDGVGGMRDGYHEELVARVERDVM